MDNVLYVPQDSEIFFAETFVDFPNLLRKELDRWRPEEACESNRDDGRETPGNFYIFIGTVLILIIIIFDIYVPHICHHNI